MKNFVFGPKVRGRFLQAKEFLLSLRTNVKRPGRRRLIELEEKRLENDDGEEKIELISHESVPQSHDHMETLLKKVPIDPLENQFFRDFEICAIFNKQKNFHFIIIPTVNIIREANLNAFLPPHIVDIIFEHGDLLVLSKKTSKIEQNLRNTTIANHRFF